MSKPAPGWVQALDRIARTETTGADRAMLLAALRWVDLTSWRLWPSLGNWAAMAGVCDRTARRALRRLEARGILVPVEPSAGGVTRTGIGCTTTYELRLPALAPNPDVVSGFSGEGERNEPGQRVIEPGQAVPRTRTNKTGNADVVSANPSIHQPVEQTKEPSTGKAVFEARGDGWMGNTTKETERGKADVIDAGTLLESLGVRGPNLSKLIDAGVTAEVIREELASIQRDRGVRNVPAVLVRRLAERVDVRLSSRPALDTATKGVVGSLEQIRRNMLTRPDAQRVGDALAMQLPRIGGGAGDGQHIAVSKKNGDST